MVVKAGLTSLDPFTGIMLRPGLIVTSKEFCTSHVSTAVCSRTILAGSTFRTATTGRLKDDGVLAGRVPWIITCASAVEVPYLLVADKV